MGRIMSRFLAAIRRKVDNTPVCNYHLFKMPDTNALPFHKRFLPLAEARNQPPKTHPPGRRRGGCRNRKNRGRTQAGRRQARGPGRRQGRGRRGGRGQRPVEQRLVHRHRRTEIDDHPHAHPFRAAGRGGRQVRPNPPGHRRQGSRVAGDLRDPADRLHPASHGRNPRAEREEMEPACPVEKEELDREIETTRTSGRPSAGEARSRRPRNATRRSRSGGSKTHGVRIHLRPRAAGRPPTRRPTNWPRCKTRS